jgi:hypothetical protein
MKKSLTIAYRLLLVVVAVWLVGVKSAVASNWTISNGSGSTISSTVQLKIYCSPYNYSYHVWPDNYDLRVTRNSDLANGATFNCANTSDGSSLRDWFYLVRGDTGAVITGPVGLTNSGGTGTFTITTELSPPTYCWWSTINNAISAYPATYVLESAPFTGSPAHGTTVGSYTVPAYSSLTISYCPPGGAVVEMKLWRVLGFGSDSEMWSSYGTVATNDTGWQTAPGSGPGSSNGGGGVTDGSATNVMQFPTSGTNLATETTLQAGVTRLHEDISGGFTAANAQLNGVNTRLAGIASSAASIDSKVSGVQSTLTTTDGRVASLVSGQTTANNSLNTVNSHLTTIENAESAANNYLATISVNGTQDVLYMQSLSNGVVSLSWGVSQLTNAASVSASANTTSTNQLKGILDNGSNLTNLVAGGNSELVSMSNRLYVMQNDLSPINPTLNNQLGPLNTTASSIDSKLSTENNKLTELVSEGSAATNLLAQIKSSLATNNFGGDTNGAVFGDINEKLGWMTNNWGASTGYDTNDLPGSGEGADWAAMGAAAGAALKASMDGVGNQLLGADYTYLGEAPNWKVTVPYMGNYEIDVNPFSQVWVVNFASFFRALVTWLTLLGVMRWASVILFDGVRSQGSFAQAQSAATVPFGSTSVAVMMAVLIVVALALLPTAVVAFMSDRLATVLNNPFSNSGGPVGVALYIADRFFPLATMAAATVNVIGFRVTSAAWLWLTQCVVRFLVG